ncbi:MAG: transposase [Caldilineaceae bacterium]
MLPQILNRLRCWPGVRDNKRVKPAQLPLGSERAKLWEVAQLPQSEVPLMVRESAAAMKYLELLGRLDWQHFPERGSERAWPGSTPAPHAPLVAALLVKLDKGIKSMAKLREELVQQPALTWLLGFPLKASSAYSWGFDVDASLPTHRHWNRLLREMPHCQAEFLLRSSVQLLQREIPAYLGFGDEISLDTKHIIAWVRENNPKAYVKGGRFHKAQQPKGDPDCKVGFKANDNQLRKAAPAEPPTPVLSAPSTPTCEGIPASQLTIDSARHADGDYYWGYASGVVANKIENWGEFVLAEMTETFDKADQNYFLPLMAQTEVNLGKQPKRGALDAAFDWFVVHQYFAPTAQEPDRFAAVPWADRADHKKSFDAAGLPLCAAKLSMPLKARVQKKTHTLVPHEVGRFVCPLLFPTSTGEACPIAHKNWEQGGCITTLPTSIGNRMRHELDRDSAEYKQLYKQRTAVERINAQALELGIERPKLRNQRSIANQNTLIYVLINLRGVQRVQERKAALAQLKE